MPVTQSSWFTPTPSGGSGSSGWTNFTVPNFTLGVPATFSLASYAPATDNTYASIASALPNGVTLDAVNKQLVYNGDITAAASSGNQIQSSITAAGDFAYRVNQPGVWFYHDWTNASEVSAFRWTNAYGSGNDPLSNGTNAANAHWLNTDGITGTCMEIVRSTGTTESSHWWRPLSPIVGGGAPGSSYSSGNGRGVDDPGCTTYIAGIKQPPLQQPFSYTATDGGGQVAGWSQQSRQFANVKYTTSTYNSNGAGQANLFANEYYVQVRIKIDPNRTSTALNQATQEGKLFWFTRCDASATDQELVTESYLSGSGAPATTDFFNVYRSVGPPLYGDSPGRTVQGDQPGSAYTQGYGDGLCDLSNGGNGHGTGSVNNCWAWPLGTWVTVLYHVKAGTMTSDTLGSGTGNHDTLLQVWVAPQGTTTYTKIWDQSQVDLPFDHIWGHSALMCSTYHNGQNMNQFYHRYCQLIFSTQTIACPQV